MRKILHSLAIALIALSVASCGGGAKVKEAIIVEDCIKIPKQSVPISIYEDDGEWDMEATIKLENIKPADESEIANYPVIIITLLDKDGVELIRMGSSISNSLITTAGKKMAIEFSLPWGDEPSKERLEDIKKEARTIVLTDNSLFEDKL